VLRHRRFVLVALLAALAVAVPAALGDLGTRKQAIDSRIDRLQAQVEQAKRRERVLTSDISAASERIDTLQDRVGELTVRLDGLAQQLHAHIARLDLLRKRYARQTAVLTRLEQTERLAQQRLRQRLVEIYETGTPDTLEILFSVSTFNDLISQLEYAQAIADRDRSIADAVATARRRLVVERARTQAIRTEEARATSLIAARTAEQRTALAELVGRRDQLVSAQDDRQALLASVRGKRQHAEEDLDSLRQASQRLADRIRSAQSSAAAPVGAAGGGGVSASGLIWPVNGPITSPFGMRWGRMHEGIDIGVGIGTPIHAAAAGTVIWAGWLGGYGNLTVIDHGAGLSTAYGHQQRIDVSVGQHVAQGETIGEVGSTGHSFGPHLHFEVRINGTAVDPLVYL
jgi:murein DD-endopeptidase MepM/ murein hydrolase activator NlpD